MKKFYLGLALCLAPLSTVSAQIGVLSTTVPESEILAGTSNAFADGEGVVVDASGIIYMIDDNGENVLRIDRSQASGSQVTILTDDATIEAAIDTANGTDAAGFDARQIDIADDGDIIVVGFGGDGDSLISINPGTGTPTVVHTSQDGTPSAINGSAGLVVVGNVAYVSTDDQFGNADAVIEIDTNDVGAPVATATEVISEADLTTLLNYPLDGGESEHAIDDMATDGTFIYGITSEAAVSGDNIIRYNPGTDTLEILVLATDIVDDLDLADDSTDNDSVTDIGLNSIEIQPNGDIWVGNPFGDGPFDQSLIRLSNINAGTMSADAEGVLVSNMEAIPEVGTGNADMGRDSLAWDASNGAIIFYNPNNNVESLIQIVPFGASVQTWNTYE